MLNFTVGPVQSSQGVRNIGAEQVPYFRTEEFSKLMLENETLIKKMAKTQEDAKVVFITGSGTASMEAAIINTLSSKDKALIINGGSFGQRFVELCQLHNINYEELKLETGCSINEDYLNSFKNKGFTALLVNYHETSTGVLYDLKLLSEFCKQNNLFFIVDCISAFLADEFDMKKLGVDVMITGSQKALACPPGISIITLSSKAVSRVNATKCPCMYLDLKSALKNMERGQTPFTPAVGILRQINYRLKELDANGGVEESIAHTKDLAEYFRKGIQSLPLTLVAQNPSNAVTALKVENNSAHEIFEILKQEYNIWICPNGGSLKDSTFRVGHIGCLTKEDYDTLITALKELHQRGIF